MVVSSITAINPVVFRIRFARDIFECICWSYKADFTEKEELPVITGDLVG